MPDVRLKKNFGTPFKCPLCPAQFVTNQRMKNHIVEIHERKKPFECSLCHAEFSREADLKIHITVVHEKKQPRDMPVVTL